MPVTTIQMHQLVNNYWYVWTNQGNLLGTVQYFHNDLPLVIYTQICILFHLSPEIYLKLLLVFPFALLGYSLFRLFRFLNLSVFVSLLGGLIYMTSPTFYNYSIIGWFLVTFSMAILPFALIAFIRSVRQNSHKDSILTGSLFALAMLQSQSLLWFPILFLSFSPFLITNRTTFKNYLVSLSITFSVFVGLMSTLWLPLFFGKGVSLNSGLGFSVISMGTWERLSNINILRNWGSLFNYQFETVYNHSLSIFSLVIPAMATASLLIKKNRLSHISLWLPILLFVLLIKLGPSFIIRLPFSDIYRDIARFSVLVSLSYSILATLLLEYLIVNRKLWKKLIAVALITAWLTYIHPFYDGSIHDRTKLLDTDIRLRTYQFPQSYILAEQKLSTIPYSKAIYIPNSVMVSTKNPGQFRNSKHISKGSSKANAFTTPHPLRTQNRRGFYFSPQYLKVAIEVEPL